MGILLNDEEIGKAIPIALFEGGFQRHTHMINCSSEDFIRVANAATKKALLGIGKEATRLDGTVYLIPDYSKYRQALKEME